MKRHVFTKNETPCFQGISETRDLIVTFLPGFEIVLKMEGMLNFCLPLTLALLVIVLPSFLPEMLSA